MCCIYALTDSDGNVGYVGQTGQQDKRQRLRNHIANAKLGSSQPVCVWIRSLVTRPDIVILEIDPTEPDEAERRWIADLTSKGIRLCNAHDGGRSAFKCYPETCEKMSKVRIGHLVKPETREKIAKALTLWKSRSCPNGHPINKRNTHVFTNKRGRTSKACRVCDRERYYAKIGHIMKGEATGAKVLV